MKNEAGEITFLSIIVPAYKAGTFIVPSLTKIDEVLRNLTANYEIICVVDGRVDDSFAKVSSLAKNKTRIKVVGYRKNRGKGYAVRYGMKRAKGEIIGFIDAGEEIDPASLKNLVEIMNESNADIVVGSKRHPESDIVYPYLRQVFSFAYLYFVKTLFGIKLTDTQAGIKLFRKEVLKKLLPKLSINGFAFDIEILALARAYGFNKVYEAPIKVRMARGEKSSTIGNLRQLIMASFEMLGDSLGLYLRMKKEKI